MLDTKRWRKYDIRLCVCVDDCIGATDEQLRSYVEYKLGLTVSKFKPLVVEDMVITRVLE